MSVEENKALTRRIFEMFNTGNLAMAGELIAADAVDHQAPPGMPPGAEGFRQLVGMFRGAFPDLRVSLEDLIAEGDKVVARSIMNGTHRGEFMGIPATGKSFRMSGIDIIRFENGQAVEHWGNTDDLGMMQQLGLAPMPGQG
jgi:steroid delta-isomerase-like uncharacterized protein